MFIRFVVGRESDDHRSLTGIFTEARLLRDKAVLNEHEERWLEDIYEWFNTNLPTPPFSSDDRLRDAVAWFKDDAGDPLTKMWEIVSIVREHGIPVRMLRSTNPGKVLYEDAFQIVIEEWKEL
jgi:hypothetical protein